jgi:acetyl-CoA carboxylase carboxyltransferase component
MSWAEDVDEIRRRREIALGMGGPERIERQHRMGRWTVRERIEALLDPGSFVEVGQLAGTSTYEDGVRTAFIPEGYVTGLGLMAGRDVVVGGEDFTVRGGSGRGERATRNKRDMAFAMAKAYRVPLVQFLDGAGASVKSTEDLGRSYLPNSKDWSDPLELTGLVPMVGAIAGSVAGGIAAYALLTHWTCMVKGAELFAAGPPVVRRALGLDVTKQELGGTEVHVHVSGAADNEADDEQGCVEQIAAFLSYMPQNVWEVPPYREPDDRPDRREDALVDIVPTSRQGYDMRRLVSLVMDLGSVFEVKPFYGRCIITQLARLNGHVVGVVANDPLFQAGALDATGADKASRFIEICDTFNIPIVHFVDVPGFMIGPAAEAQATLRAGMRMLWLGHQVTVPTMAVHVRRCYGMAGVATSTPARLGLRLGWPSGEWGSMPIEGGVDAAYRRLIDASDDPVRARKEIEERLNLMKSVFPIAEAFGVEDLIDPRDTRRLLIRYLEAALPAQQHQLGPKARVGVRP